MTEFSIRAYQPNDREAVFRISADTAFFGDPIERYLDDRRLFYDAFYRYYTDYEPESGWIACAGDEVAGFLMGSLDTRKQEQAVQKVILPQVIRRLVSGHYRLGRKTVRYAYRLVRAGLAGEFPHTDLARYPAHLHINLSASWRGYGLGKRLMLAYLEYLRSQGITGVHLSTTSMNEIACQLYERIGFTLLDRRPTRIWEQIIEKPVENRIYGMRLVPDSTATPSSCA